ncbi:MAG: pitrilysin family protein [Planctomycetota bacterium]|nr:pitrilysin family protein [Planctomycetota bacterium]
MRRAAAWSSVAALVLSALVAGGCRLAGEERPEATPAPIESVRPARERIERLPNGLEVIVRERHLGGVAAFRVYVGAGSLNEGEYAGSGISHLLEHVVSGGSTDERTEAATREALEAIGAQTNAHTSKQFVCYHGQAEAGRIGELIDIISDYVMNSRVDAKEFAREFEVVQREQERAEASPDQVLWRLADENFFLNHPARYPVIGYLDALRRLRREDLAAFYGRAVRPDNAVAVAVGDFNADQVFEEIRSALGGWERRSAAPVVLGPRETQVAPRRAEEKMDVASVRAILEFPTVQLTHPDLYPLDILAFVLGEGRASRLVADLRERRGLVQEITCFSYTPAGYDGGRLSVLFQAEPERAEAARTAALEHLARAAREGITAEELARAKRQKTSEYVFSLQACETIAADLGTNALLVGDPHFSDRYVRNIQGVTLEDVKRVAAKYLRPEVLCETVVRPKEKTPAEGEKPPAPAVASQRPEIISRVLANGVRLLLCPVADSQTVSIQMGLRGGLSIESEKNAGISHFMSRMLLKGTSRHTASEIASATDAMGADLNASSGRNTIYLSARCLAEDFEKTFDLASASVLEPTFPPQEVELMRGQLLAELAQMEDTPHGEAALFFQRCFFTDSPYRFPVQGSAEVVAALGREDLAGWHKRLVVGNNLVVAVFGGMDLVKAANYVARQVESLPANPNLKFPADVAPRKTAGREVYIKPSEKGAAIVYVAYPGMDIYNIRDRFPMDVLDTVVSGYQMPSGWLHEELRGKGLVYEVHAYTMTGLLPGCFAAYAVCQPEKAAEVARTIESAMKRAASHRFEEKELAPARATIVTAKELGRETVDGWAFEAAVDEALGLGAEFAREEIERVRAVTPEEVRRVAGEYLKTPVICIVTSDAKAAETIRK